VLKVLATLNYKEQQVLKVLLEQQPRKVFKAIPVFKEQLELRVLLGHKELSVLREPRALKV
jgi:hypothetical protein